MSSHLSLAIESARTRPPVIVSSTKLDSPLFYGGNSAGIQVWYSLKGGNILAHLQDGSQEYVGKGSSYKRALKALENTAPERYHHTINYMRVCVWQTG
jgi:hypothetical protein